MNTSGDVAPVFRVCSTETDVLTSVSPQRLAARLLEERVIAIIPSLTVMQD